MARRLVGSELDQEFPIDLLLLQRGFSSRKKKRGDRNQSDREPSDQTTAIITYRMMGMRAGGSREIVISGFARIPGSGHENLPHFPIGLRGHPAISFSCVPSPAPRIPPVALT